MDHTAKSFVLQLGSLIALYVSLSALVAITFGIINLIFPDEAMGYWQYESSQSQIRFGIAMLIVFFPVYVALTRTVNQLRRKSGEKYLTLTKWLIYLSLLGGGGILLGDLVAVIFAFLDGEITVRFILKALALLIIIGAAFKYYLLDARGYWNTHEEQSKMFAAVGAVVVVAVLVLGFFHTDTPSQVRDMRLDEEQVRDLEDMQWRIEEYVRVNGALPINLEQVYGSVTIPTAPEGREEYTFTLLSSSSFELCATFAHKSPEQSKAYRPVTGEIIKNPYSWDHDSGRACFERAVAL